MVPRSGKVEAPFDKLARKDRSLKKYLDTSTECNNGQRTKKIGLFFSITLVCGSKLKKKKRILILRNMKIPLEVIYSTSH